MILCIILFDYCVLKADKSFFFKNHTKMSFVVKDTRSFINICTYISLFEVPTEMIKTVPFFFTNASQDQHLIHFKLSAIFQEKKTEIILIYI